MGTEIENTMSPFDYPTALHKLLSQVDYERMNTIAPPLNKVDIGRMLELATYLENPHLCAPVIHIAGTKGKGSVAAMVSSILTCAGLRTGLFTSPHLHTFTERIRLNGQPITKEEFARRFSRVWPYVDSMGQNSVYGKPSTFEILTAMAFETFREAGVDAQVLEVGLGGRLDSTNIADANVAVITRLSLDHTAILGNQIELIAKEKGGIIKPKSRVIVSPQEDSAFETVMDICRKFDSEVVALGRDVTWQRKEFNFQGQEATIHTLARTYNVWLPLLGAHQIENAAAAISAVEATGWDISENDIVSGIKNVKWDGRLQVLSPSPLVVVDGAHNPHSIERLVEAVEEYINPQRTWLVFGSSSDKDLSGMVEAIAPIIYKGFVCESRHPRAIPMKTLKEAFFAKEVKMDESRNVGEALSYALNNANERDLILVTGSLFVVSEALEAWFGIEPEMYPELNH